MSVCLSSVLQRQGPRRKHYVFMYVERRLQVQLIRTVSYINLPIPKVGVANEAIFSDLAFIKKQSINKSYNYYFVQRFFFLNRHGQKVRFPSFSHFFLKTSPSRFRAKKLKILNLRLFILFVSQSSLSIRIVWLIEKARF